MFWPCATTILMNNYSMYPISVFVSQILLHTKYSAYNTRFYYHFIKKDLCYCICLLCITSQISFMLSGVKLSIIYSKSKILGIIHKYFLVEITESLKN